MTVVFIGNIAAIINLFVLLYMLTYYLPSRLKKIGLLEARVHYLENKPLPKSVQLLNRLKERARQGREIEYARKENEIKTTGETE